MCARDVRPSTWARIVHSGSVLRTAFEICTRYIDVQHGMQRRNTLGHVDTRNSECFSICSRFSCIVVGDVLRILLEVPSFPTRLAEPRSPSTKQNPKPKPHEESDATRMWWMDIERRTTTSTNFGTVHPQRTSWRPSPGSSGTDPFSSSLPGKCATGDGWKIRLS